jgi:hypothetical protein
MSETIMSRSAAELLECRRRIALGNTGFGTLWMINKRMWILRRYIRICGVKGIPLGIQAFSMLGEFELAKGRLFDSL